MAVAAQGYVICDDCPDQLANRLGQPVTVPLVE
jgi:hypothetical protein